MFSFSAGSYALGALVLGFIQDDDAFDTDPSGFVSMSLSVDVTAGGSSSDTTWTFTDLASLDAFLTDDVIDLGYTPAPITTFTLSHVVTADGTGGIAFDYAFATVPEPASGGLLLTSGGLLWWLRRTGHRRKEGKVRAPPPAFAGAGLKPARGQSPIGVKIKFDSARIGRILGADAEPSISPGGPVQRIAASAAARYRSRRARPGDQGD